MKIFIFNPFQKISIDAATDLQGLNDGKFDHIQKYIIYIIFHTQHREWIGKSNYTWVITFEKISERYK